jgi:hypothetical protein
MAEIKTAQEVIASIDRLRKRTEQEKKEFNEHRAVLENYEDLRDEVMGLIRSSGVSFGQIYDRFGPHPHTLENWAERKIHQPRLGKMQAALRAIGYDLGIIEGRRRRGGVH